MNTTKSPHAVCASCGVPLPEGARFCSSCGAATRTHARRVAQRSREERQRHVRAGSALGLVVMLTLLGLYVLWRWGPEHEDGGWVDVLPTSLVVFVAAFAAGVVDGPLRHSLPLGTRWVWLLLSLPGACVTLGFAMVYLQVLFAGTAVSGTEAAPVTLATWVAVVVLAPLGEEWLCRGVAWRSAVTLSSPRTALLLTAILFAFLHGLGGIFLLELPHRFVMGLVAGWLRWQSGSLLPGIAVHALHNFVAITWLSG